MSDLQWIRDQVDIVDREIAKLFEKRMRLVDDIAGYKLNHHMDVVELEREGENKRALMDEASCEFNAMGIHEILEQIISISRKRQYQIQTQHGIEEDPGFAMIDRIPKDRRVVFQGVKGAFSYAAMYKYFGKEVDCYNVDTFKEALDDILAKKADFAVLPIENSTAGIVTDMYDLLMEYDITIVDEQTIKVEHNLLGVPGARLEDITDVYSHPQALSQCKYYLDAHPDWNRHEYFNTAAAARMIMETGDPTKAAISSRYAAEVFEAEILAENIFFDTANSTRFIIASGEKIFREDANRVSICFDLKHSRGSLYSVLSHIMYNSLNMTMIESRPIPDKPWEYRFFVDFEGNINDSAVKNALRGIRMEASDLRILGNY